MNSADLAAILISILALIFAVGSFWWMNWRKGSLKIGAPRSYAITNTDAALTLQLPFIFFNNGPLPIFVRNLRIVFPDENPQEQVVFQGVVEKLGSTDMRMATQFPVRGLESQLNIYVFIKQGSRLRLEPRSYRLELQATLDESSDWATISRFRLNIGEEEIETIRTQKLRPRDNMREI